ncbi:MAG TPA: AarF/UbiB family protein [Candidatus Koribacter sp.]
MAGASQFAAYLQQLFPEELQSALRQFLPADVSTARRIALVEAALRSKNGPALRREIGRWIVDKLVPVAALVPNRFAVWREPTRESMLFVIEQLSVERLAPKLVEQLELPPRTSPEARLLKLIARVPGLQKLGQVLARNRHLRHSVRIALSKLENGIRDVEIDEVIAVIRQELGGKLRQLNIKLEPALLSEASVSAVLRFTWWNAANQRREKGVFKVLKPHIPQCFAEDMSILQALADFFGRRAQKGFSSAVIPDTFSKIRQHLQHEVDFPGEQAALLQAPKQFKSLRGVRIPRLIPQLCTARLTAMSEEEGVKVTTAAAHLSPERRMRLAQQLVEALVAFPLLSREPSVLFHADPHAGNLLYDRKTGEIVILDWALGERLDREQRRRLALLFLSVGLRNPAAAAAHIAALSEHRLSSQEQEAIRRTANEFMDALPLAALPRAVDAMGLLEQVALTGIRFPSSLIMFSKVLFTLDGILDDIRGNGATTEFTIARYLFQRWMRQPLSLGVPLSVRDWIGVECSALLYRGQVRGALRAGAHGPVVALCAFRTGARRFFCFKNDVVLRSQKFLVCSLWEASTWQDFAKYFSHSSCCSSLSSWFVRLAPTPKGLKLSRRRNTSAASTPSPASPIWRLHPSTSINGVSMESLE